MSVPVVSVVIPTYARPAKLIACLEALARQAFAEPWEVVVVDDGSPEPVEPPCIARPPNLEFRIVRQENAGPAAARNRAVLEARGALVAFTDDDCLPDPAWLETLVRAGRENELALVGGSTFNGLRDDVFATTSQLIIDLVYEHFNADHERSYFLASNNVLCSRARFLELGGFDTAFPRAGAEDREFCDRWRMHGWPLVWRPAALVEHRHGQTLRRFIDLHVRYGRGAYLYQAMRRGRGSGTMQEDLGFHRSLLRRTSAHLGRVPGVTKRAKVLAALGLWQLANAVGFGLEAAAARARRAKPR